MRKLALSSFYLIFCSLAYSAKIKSTTVDPFEQWFTFKNKKEGNTKITTTTTQSFTTPDEYELMPLYDSKDYENLEEFSTETPVTTFASELDPFEAEFEKLFDDYENMDKNDFDKKYTEPPLKSKNKEKTTTKESKNFVQQVIDENFKTFQTIVLNGAAFLDSVIENARNFTVKKKF